MLSESVKVAAELTLLLVAEAIVALTMTIDSFDVN